HDVAHALPRQMKGGRDAGDAGAADHHVRCAGIHGASRYHEPVPMHVRGNARQRLRDIARRAMLERGLEPDFSPAARAEAEATRGQADGSGALKDLRDLLWCSIDNDDSKDLDQLTVALEATAGARRVLVAVADVDAAVAKDSALDAHARVNTTSVYTAAQVFPMLPERMSTDLTSLNQDADRLAIVVDVTVGAD